MNTVELIFNQQKIKGIWRDAVDESVWAEIFKWREYRVAEPVITTTGQPLIFDIGAHAGFFTIYCLALNSHAQVIGLEPLPENINAWNANLRLNGWENLAVLDAQALLPTSGVGWLYLSVDSHNHRASSALISTSKDKLAIRGISLLDLVQKNKITKIDLLKMDIEGEEYELLKIWGDAEYVLLQNIILEYHEFSGYTKKMLSDILHNHGFGVRIFPSQFDKNMGIIFANNKKNNNLKYAK